MDTLFEVKDSMGRKPEVSYFFQLCANGDFLDVTNSHPIMLGNYIERPVFCLTTREAVFDFFRLAGYYVVAEVEA